MGDPSFSCAPRALLIEQFNQSPELFWKKKVEFFWELCQATYVPHHRCDNLWRDLRV